MSVAKKPTTILAVETSCDETGIAILDCEGGATNPQFSLRSNIVASQVDLHAEFGGVVPNIAKREHIKQLPAVFKRALKEAKIKDPSKEINALAVTVGPGLEPALWTGITFTQELAQKLALPVVAGNHMEGHLITPLLSPKAKKIHFPAIALLVSGGHTEIVLAKGWLDYKVIGETVDDAAGEAFDKVARMLELGYPGGPIISKLAETGNRYSYSFPRPMINAKNYNFSFSGLKTAVLYTLKELVQSKTIFSKNDIAASFEDAVVDVLLLKTLRAIREYKAKTLIIGGGVAANKHLRSRFEAALKKEKTQVTLHLPELALSGDNAAMIAAAAYLHAARQEFTAWNKLEAHATLAL